MAAGDYSDFLIYEPEFYSGMFEAIDQYTTAFNAASAGAIRLVQRRLKGHFEKESFIEDIASLVTYRDIADISAATDAPMTHGENVAVKVNRKIGPVAQTIDAWRKLGSDAAEMSFQLGQAVGSRQIRDYLNTGLIAAETCLQLETTLTTDKSGGSPGTMTHGFLFEALSKFGDAQGDVVAWVMHSKPWFDLMQQAITDKIFEVAGVTIMSGTVASLNRPIIVTDSPALTDANGSAADTYNVLGLTAGALEVNESEERQIVSDVVTGLENLVLRVQGEYAFNLKVRGFAYDVTKGENPDDTLLGTTSSWTRSASSVKHCAGVRLKVK